MFKRLCVSVFILAITTSLTLAQEIRRIYYEEIKAVPENRKGEWTIGNYKFEADDVTEFDFDNPPKVGALAEIKFVIRGKKLVATKIEPQSILASEITDGPYVFWKDDATAEVLTFHGGKPHRKIIKNIARPIKLDKLAGIKTRLLLNPDKPITPKSSWDAPKKLLAISDLEGNYNNVLAFLQKNKVVDKDGKWDWGDGHLVLIGDLIDRGSKVTELMWFLRRLEYEAEKAGGRVHYVLGNHEAMVMAGDLRYIHPKYHFVTGRLGIRYDQLYSNKSDIGRWWRSKNAVVKIGDLLFVHGGYSPVLDAAKLDMDTLNKRIRAGLAPKTPTGTTAATNPIAHKHGPFWYRGYFDRHAAEWGGKAKPEEIQKILDRHKVKHIVIGHTLVEKVGPLDDTGKVIAVDVKWADAKKGEGLLVEDGKMWRLKTNTKKEELKFRKTTETEKRSRLCKRVFWFCS